MIALSILYFRSNDISTRNTGFMLNEFHTHISRQLYIRNILFFHKTTISFSTLINIYDHLVLFLISYETSYYILT